VHSKGFVYGFEKTADIAGIGGKLMSGVLKPAKWAGGVALKAAGGPLTAGLTALGAGMDFAQGNNKMKANQISARV
jgi:hypothetical protein